MWKEFKEFAIKGNALDLAIAVIVAAAFQPIVTSMVNDLIMPPISLINSAAGKTENFKDRYISLDGRDYGSLENARKVSAPVIGYGNFISTVINFFIISFCVFLIVKAMNKFKRQKEMIAPPPPAQEVLLTEIRDLLKARPLP
jgi:large conductance mechanosensitive channel